MLTLIKNAQIVNEGGIYKSDVLIENQIIKKIANLTYVMQTSLKTTIIMRK